MARPQFDAASAPDLRERMAAAATKLAAAAPKASAEFDAPERRQWDFWPSKYAGLRADQADSSQQQLIDELLRLGLSEAGYRKLRLIQAIEPLNPWRSPYYSTLVFGDPANRGNWGWRYQGHHMSVNFTMSTGAPVATTPLFLGTQPLSSPSIAAGAAPLAQEEALARRLFQGLQGGQRRQATIGRPPYTYLPERTPRAKPYEPAGVPASALTAQDRETLDALIRSYVDNAAPPIAEAWRQAFAAEADKIRFAWAGSDDPGRDHYYRITGGDLLIEYDSRDGGSHIHSVWRSLSRDFGGDPLRAHYAATAHPSSAGW